jgi:hypothetical protein
MRATLQVIADLKRSDGCGRKKTQLEAQLSGQFDQAITNATQVIGAEVKK